MSNVERIYSNSGRVLVTPNQNIDMTKAPNSASPSLYNTFNDASSTLLNARALSESRLWKGVPQLSSDQLAMFEAAYTGHQFFFVTVLPRFMTTGIYQSRECAMNIHAQNLKSLIENASTTFAGAQNIMADFGTQDDGNSRKVDHLARVYKEQSDISFTIHEFAGLPLKNAIETWLTGALDYRTVRGNYFGNLNIPNGWSTYNHTMSVLAVQVNPDWTEIQDAAYYYNMIPIEVPFAHFDWTKGDHNIVPDLDITFKANEERSPAVMEAAIKWMNAKVLDLVDTSVFDSRKFDAQIADPS